MEEVSFLVEFVMYGVSDECFWIFVRTGLQKEKKYIVRQPQRTALTTAPIDVSMMVVNCADEPVGFE